MFSLTRSLKMGDVPREGFVFLSLTRLMQTGYVLGLSAVVSLLLSSATSKGQFGSNNLPAPPMMLPVNNMMTASTGGAMSMGGMGGMGGMMMGMMGMTGMMDMGGFGGMMGMGGMNMMGGMMGFAGKGMGGFNGKKAL